MGLEDRDYYREDYAKKNGMKYNPRNATYRSAQQNQDIPARRDEPQSPEANEYSFIGKFVMTVIVLSCAAMAYRYLR